MLPLIQKWILRQIVRNLTRMPGFNGGGGPSERKAHHFGAVPRSPHSGGLFLLVLNFQ